MLEANDRLLETLLKMRLSIPRAQRPYTWEEEQRNEFWSDLNSYLTRADVNNSKSDEEFFIGSFLFLKDLSNDDSYQVYDGQQRITTLYLLYISIWYQAKELEDEYNKNKDNNNIEIGKSELFEKYYGDKIDKLSVFIYNNISSNQSKRITTEFFFTPHEKLIPVFKKLWEFENWSWDFSNSMDPTKVPYHEVDKTLKFFRDRIKEIGEGIEHSDQSEYHAEFYYKLNQLADKIDKIKYVEMIIESNDEAGRLFEGLNARGKPLNVSDLLKNFLFGIVIDKKYDDEEVKLSSLEKKWEDILKKSTEIPDEVSIGKASEEMLKHFAQMLTKDPIGINNTYRVLKEHINNKMETENDWGPIQFLEEFAEFANIYNLLRVQTTIHHSDLKNIVGDLGKDILYDTYIAFKYFKDLKLVVFTSSICSLILAIKHQRITAKQLSRILKILRNYHVINKVVCKRGSNEIDSDLKLLSFKLYENEFSNDDSEKFINAIKTTVVDKDTFVENFSGLRYGSASVNKSILYILLKIEMDSCEDSTDKQRYEISEDNWSLEHWLAIKAENEEGQESDLLKDFDGENFSHIHKLGNLLPLKLKKNKNLSNKEPSNKINLFDITKNGDEHMRKFISDYEKYHDNWNRQTINNRTNQLASDIYSTQFSIEL